MIQLPTLAPPAAAGNFTGDLSDDLSAAKPDELASVFRWRNFFNDHQVVQGLVSEKMPSSQPCREVDCRIAQRFRLEPVSPGLLSPRSDLVRCMEL